MRFFTKNLFAIFTILLRKSVDNHIFVTYALSTDGYLLWRTRLHAALRRKQAAEFDARRGLRKHEGKQHLMPRGLSRALRETAHDGSETGFALVD
ncbi:MAG: hypothetical protein LBL36_06460 [Clostridiales Family XIII bacterium]|nr:hypothetical protein [Clostridiales Family XIII bacterium]